MKLHIWDRPHTPKDKLYLFEIVRTLGKDKWYLFEIVRTLGKTNEIYTFEIIRIVDNLYTFVLLNKFNLQDFM